MIHAQKIIKRLLFICFIFTVVVLSSCVAVSGYAEPESQYIVSAMGFDVSGGRVEVSAEIIDGGSERILSGVGSSIEQAISALLAQETKSLEVSHCAILVLGENADAEWIEKISGFCRRNEDITVAAQLVSASNAKELLSIEGVNGYDLASTVSKNHENAAFGAESRYYSVQNTRISENNVYALPHFTVNDDEYELYGVQIFCFDVRAVLLNRAEAAYYMMARGLFDRGLVPYDAPGLSGSVGVSDCKTEYKFIPNGDKLSVNIKCILTIDSELGDDEYAQEIARATGKGMLTLWEKLAWRYGDIFKLRENAALMGTDLDPSIISEASVSFECIVKK